MFLPAVALAVLISMISKLSSKGPILHWSKRVGFDNKIFFMPKFRTMTVQAPDLASHLMIDPDKYITWFGSFLRKTSLDEIPQLWSVIKGDMALVGPRPALHNQFDLTAMRTKIGIHELKPGITGLAQIKGRDRIGLKHKVKYDFFYTKKRCLFFDLRIIFLTVFSALRSRDVSH